MGHQEQKHIDSPAKIPDKTEPQNAGSALLDENGILTGGNSQKFREVNGCILIFSNRQMEITSIVIGFISELSNCSRNSCEFLPVFIEFGFPSRIPAIY